MSILIIIVIVAVLILVAVIGMAILGRRKKPRCACFEFVGDNPNCPIADHRIAVRAGSRPATNRGRI